MKRCLDVFGAVLLLLALSPLFAILAALVRLRLGTPVLFRQQRIGFGERRFVLLKFRTMRWLNGPDGLPLPDADRLTPFGSWLRSWSLDELPQLWNVLRGEMSFIGPRPLLPEYLPLYSAAHRRRHSVRPGLSGLAQINGRNELEWGRRFDLDVEYVQRQSLWLDLRIAMKTVGRLMSREGISRSGEATMTKFRGLETSG